MTDPADIPTVPTGPITQPHAAPSQPAPERTHILVDANTTINGPRQQEYGDPDATFERIARLWSAHLGTHLNASDVPVLMILAKVARLNGNPLHRDSYVDIAGYAGLAAEVASRAA